MRLALVLLALVVTSSAQAGVRVVAPFDPADYADRAAVGLLVPGAGPTVTRESAVNALLRGKLEHDLLGGVAHGEPRIELGAAAGPTILVSLPPQGRSENDTRYPIALLGERGMLTSDSTRMDGLVSITDVATGRLRVVPNNDPVEALETLDRRIDRNDRLRLPASQPSRYRSGLPVPRSSRRTSSRWDWTPRRSLSHPSALHSRAGSTG